MLGSKPLWFYEGAIKGYMDISKDLGRVDKNNFITFYCLSLETNKNTPGVICFLNTDGIRMSINGYEKQYAL